jgi:hypothetical protein
MKKITATSDDIERTLKGPPDVHLDLLVSCQIRIRARRFKRA